MMIRSMTKGFHGFLADEGIRIPGGSMLRASFSVVLEGRSIIE
jgi:hypothetical protein